MELFLFKFKYIFLSIFLSGSCFQTLTKKMSWEEAKSECASLAGGSSLAKITSKEENNFVIGKYLNPYKKVTGCLLSENSYS